jgi:hypothetical protein
MKRSFAAITLVLVMSCSEQDSADSPSPKEDRAIMMAAAKCGCLPKMPWLREMIRQAESDFNYEGEFFAIKYSGGVAILNQPWISSCLGCMTYDCDGNRLILNSSAMNEIISGTTEHNVIYSSF